MKLEDDTRSSSRPHKHRSQTRELGDVRHSPDRHQSSEAARRRQARVESEADLSAYQDEPPARHIGLAEFNQDLYGQQQSAPRGQELVRRTTDLPLTTRRQSRPSANRSHSADHIDMNLAYGEFHPESLALDPMTEQKLQKQEMSSLVLKCKMLMEEANCAQHSVRAIITHLQKNPDSMAAVALTLAEISNLAGKMAPSALAVFKAGAPSVFAMLAAPEFLIAVGVGVGITVVMFGGYKIIKKIKARIGDKEEDQVDEMIDMHELDRIDHWRRGISDVETASVATSVEGEFITPMAAASMGHLPLPQDRSKEKKKKHSRRVDDDPDRTVVGSEASSRSRGSKSRSEKREKAVVKVKKPSGLRRMFSSKDSDGSSRR
jgi:hypothetical protein